MNKNRPQALIPHSYPICIKICFIISLSFLFISYTYFPFYLDINKRRKKADIEFKRKNFQASSRLYMELFLDLPNHKYFKIYAAKSLFKSLKEQDHLIGMSLIVDLSFTKEEWKELLQWIPQKYREMCSSLEEKK